MNDEVGVIPRAIDEIFANVEEMTDCEFNISCSFVELYQEKLYDLLSPNQREQSVVDIREVDGKVFIPNLTETSVNNISETTHCLIRGSSDRAVGSTAMNETSSRSHAIFTITVQKVPKENRDAATTAKFHLVDLAGSERSKKTGAVGEQFKEGVKINQGLLALGNVISALGLSNQNGTGHIAYRDSKLTRLLQDSLGGNSMTLMIACISPADYNSEETLGTLRYADRAKKIKNKPIVNEDPKTAEINRLKNEIQTLRVEMLSKSAYGSATMDSCKQCVEPPTKQQLQKQIREISVKMQMNLFEMANREHIITEYEETIDTLNGKIMVLKEQIINLDKANTADMSPEDLKQYCNNVHVLTSAMMNITEHVNERKESILQSSKASESQLFNSARSTLTNNDDEFAENNEDFMKKQSNYQDELREMNHDLDVKSELLKKITENHNKFCGIDDIQAKMKEYEEKITKLERERDDPKEQLRGKNGLISAKLAEERRKRVQQLEIDIADIKKKNKQQALLLKQREKDAEQIRKCMTEIQEMKQNKVKLVRKMKDESDKFRQWKQDREKEIVQMRAKDRKNQTEAARKDLLHQKQRIVLQRKFEESNAANKRLKEALLRVQKSKENKQKNGTKVLNRSMSWLNEEIEIISSIVDIKQSYDQLVETRAELTKRLNKTKKTKPIDTDAIKVLEDEIEMHNAQINDFNEKIQANDLEAKVKSITENAQSISESKNTMKTILTNYIELRQHFNTYFAQARDLKHSMETLEEQKNEEINAMKRKYDEERLKRNELEHEFEQKTHLLLSAMSTEGLQSELIEIYQKKLQLQQEEIEHLKSKKRVRGPRVTEVCI